jgi:hypothetical protein
MTQDERIQVLSKALETCVTELATLAPRLTPQYRKNVETAREIGLKALHDTRPKPPYPFCRHPEKCIPVGRCLADPCCAD